MSAQDRLWRDEERSPALARDQSGQGGDDRPVRPGEPRPGDLAAKDRHLVTEHQDLCVLATASIRWTDRTSMTRRTKR